VARHGERLVRVTEIELTQEMITAAMAKAAARVCVGNARCYPFPDRLAERGRY
jgi:hypothetical protein